MESRKEIVYKNHYAGCNCAQSIFAAYYDIFGGIDERGTALKLALPFGGGLARSQDGMCGALCGSAMLLGLKYGPVESPSSEEIWEYHALLKRFKEDFEELNGGVLCKDIIRCDITTPEKYEAAHENFEKYCVKAIMSAADLLEDKYGILGG